jgi:hypothetical protein
VFVLTDDCVRMCMFVIEPLKSRDIRNVGIIPKFNLWEAVGMGKC